MKTVGGFVYAHNAVDYDYCLSQCVEGLAAVCDEVILADCESTDATLANMEALAALYDHVRVVKLPWKPNRDGCWLADLANECRSMLKTDFWFHLQADEVIRETDYDTVRELRKRVACRIMPRLNFLTTPFLLCPPNRVCGPWVVRFAPISEPIIGDGEGANGHGATREPIPIFHYGFIRNPTALAAKAKVTETAFKGGYNPIHDRLPTEGLGILKEVIPEPLTPYSGTHPTNMLHWLRDRGHAI